MPPKKTTRKAVRGNKRKVAGPSKDDDPAEKKKNTVGAKSDEVSKVEKAMKDEESAKSTSTQIDKPESSACTEAEKPANSASTQIEKPANSASKQIEKTVKSASPQVDKPTNSANTKTNKATKSASSQKEKSAKSASTQLEKPAKPVSTRIDKPENSEAQEESGLKIETQKGRGRKRTLVIENDVEGKRTVPHGKKIKVSLSLEQFMPSESGDRVLSCGEGEQLGHPGRTTTKKPRAICTLPSDKKILQVVAGGVHSLVLLEDGLVYSCGINEKGTVPAEGVEAEDSTDEFAEIKFDEEIAKKGKLVMLAAGASFSAGLTEKGSVIAWGSLRDSSGSIEIHKVLRDMEHGPAVIVHHDFHQIVKIAAGENHLVMLSSNGELLTFGDGSLGQLGRSARAKLIRSQYMVDDKGNNLRVTVTEKGKTVYFDDIMAGGYWTAARSTDGRIFVCGLNNFGQLGVPTPKVNSEEKQEEEELELRIMHLTVSPAFQDYRIIDMCGLQHVIALDNEGKIYGIGKNTDNALGLGTWSGKDDHEHWKYETMQLINMESKIVGITAKLGCSVAWNAEGKAFSWGCDTSGQLGLGIKDDEEKVVSQPKLITSAHLDGYKIIGVSIADNHSLFLAKKL